jgi:hypothetical protein
MDKLLGKIATDGSGVFTRQGEYAILTAPIHVTQEWTTIEAKA